MRGGAGRFRLSQVAAALVGPSLVAPARIALVCHARHPIRPPFAGGLEAHNWHLAHALMRRGHAVTVFASGDSDPSFDLAPIVQVHMEATHAGAEHTGDAALQEHGDRAYAATCARIQAGGFDVVHNHSLHRLVPLAARDHAWACVTTLHTPPLGGLEWFIRDSLSARHRVTAASRAQLHSWWPHAVPEQATVLPNGIDLDRWPFSPSGDGSAVWSGRIAPDKGPHLAIDAARRAGLALTLAGPVEDHGFFAREIVPRLDHDIRHVGALDTAALAGLLGRASVFLSTPCWPEPFGLAAIEAMACGLPVAAFDAGAVREVVGEQSGRFAAPGDVAGLAGALLSARVLDRAAAHAHVRRRYALPVMVDRTLELYRAVIGN